MFVWDSTFALSTSNNMKTIQTQQNKMVAIINKVLPEIGKGISYNEATNSIKGSAFTSAMGNIYFKELQISNTLIVMNDVGIGYCRSFLNGVKVYTLKNNVKTLVGQVDLHCVFYNQFAADRYAKEILVNAFVAEAKKSKQDYNLDSFKEFAEELISATKKPSAVLAVLENKKNVA
jgi:hypothetical protein